MRLHPFHHGYAKPQPVPQDNIVGIDQRQLFAFSERICGAGSTCKYPQLALRLLVYMLSHIDSEGKAYINARKVARKLDVHYDTVTKCLKYLRHIDAVRVEKKSHY